MEPPDPEVVSVEPVYHGKLFDVHVTTLRMPNGVETRRETLLHPGAVCAVPVDAEGRIFFVTQYRHAAGARLLELPAGTLEPGEDPGTTVVRELQEEIGMHPASVEPIGGFYVAPGYTSEYIWLYVCRDLTASNLDGDEDEDIEVHLLTLPEALEAIVDGRICDAKSVIGVLKWARQVGR